MLMYGQRRYGWGCCGACFGMVVPVQPLSSAARSGQAWLFQFEGLNRIEPQAEPFIANQEPDSRGSDHQHIAHRDLRIFAIPEQAPAVAEQLVAVGVKELRERIR